MLVLIGMVGGDAIGSNMESSFDPGSQGGGGGEAPFLHHFQNTAGCRNVDMVEMVIIT